MRNFNSLFFLRYTNSLVSYHVRVLSIARRTPSLTIKDYNLGGGSNPLRGTLCYPSFYCAQGCPWPVLGVWIDNDARGGING